MKQSMRVLTSSETQEWYTPKWITDTARATMGRIDLDPATCIAAQEWIRATHWYDAKEDGLTHHWFGCTWLNPPYGKTGNESNQDIWARKLEEEYRACRVSEALLLTKTVPGYEWWERLFRLWPVCMLEHRVRFLRLDGRGKVYGEGRAKAGTSIWYFAPPERWMGFCDKWTGVGRIIWPPKRGLVKVPT